MGARLVENETSQHTSLHDTSLHDTSLHDTPLHDLLSTPAESTPSSLPVPSSCDIVSGVGHASRTPPSPRRHTNMELAAAGVRKACLPEVIYKNMLLANTVCAALRRIGRETKDQKKLITALLSGPEIKRARLRSTICKKVWDLGEKTVRRKTDMSLQDSTKKRTILPAASDELRHTIYVLLSRDDNSSLCPAKAASTHCEEGRKQNRILSDYVYALHLKFLSENTDMKVSQSLFYRLVPKTHQVLQRPEGARLPV